MATRSMSATPRRGSAASFAAARAIGSAGAFVAAVLVMATVGVTLGAMGHELAYQAAIASLTGLTILRAVAALARRPHGTWVWLAVSAGLASAAAGVIASGMFSGNHLYVAFLLGFAAIIASAAGFGPAAALRITNAWYLAYVTGSLLVYTGVLELGRGLNIFDAAERIPGLQFPTLVGLYGSTAHIDSISMFVAILNVAFGRGRSRWSMVILAGLASVAAARWTPGVSMALSGVVAAMAWSLRNVPSLRRAFLAIVAAGIAGSAILAVLLVRSVGSDALELALNRASSGRLRVWGAMLDAAIERLVWPQWLFGVGTSEEVLLVGGWPRVNPISREVEAMWTANAHNSYLAVAFTLGAFGFVALLLALVTVYARLRSSRATFVLTFVLAVGMTNAELFTYQFPVYALWFVLLVRQTPKWDGAPGKATWWKT